MDPLLEQIQDENIIAWIMNNEIKTERGTPLNFEKFAFMIDPYLDWTPVQGTRKCSQIGWSVMTNLKLFYASKFGVPGYMPNLGANVIYTLPSDEDVNMFVPSKTDLLVQNNPILKEYIRDAARTGKVDVDSIKRKQVGNSMVYFKGTRSRTAAIMLSADLLIHDEADRSEKHIIEQYESRIAQSIYKGKWIFSNPSVPNMPADTLYMESDQKHWFIKCEHCGAWQWLGWFKTSEFKVSYDSSNPHSFVDDENEVYICGKCTAPISDENRQRGKWVAKNPRSPISGYWVTHLMCSWISAKELLYLESTKTKEYFYNFVLGLPYIGSDTVVDAQTITNNIVLDDPSWVRGKVALGVDNGDIKHWVLMNEKGVFAYGKTKSWDDIEALIKKYDPWTVIDLNPYPTKPRELARKYRKVKCSFYVDNDKTLNLFEFGVNKGVNMVYPSRDRFFDWLVEYISEGSLPFLRSKAYWEEYTTHWETMYKAKLIGQKKAEEASTMAQALGQVRTSWLSSTGLDHYCHATLYAAIGYIRLLGGQAQVLKGGSSKEKLAAISRELGGVKKAVITNEAGQQIINRSVPDLVRLSLNKNKKRSGATSGNM